ncbi:hypothetical protein IA939_02970 [Listeria welshimeri]|nr:hypothetical protein [Listeria welshimeri]
MSDYNTKLEIEDWKSNGENGIDINRLYYLKFDSDVEDINERLNETRFMSGFSYTKIDKTFQELVNDLSILNAYIVKVLDEIDEKIDEPYYQELNRGVLEDLERIKLEDFTIPNNLGITEEKYVTTSDPTAQYGVTTTTVRTEKKELTLEDMLNNYEMDGSQGFKTFTDMYRDQFQSMQQATDEMKDLDFNDYVNAVIHQADYQHTVDAGWLNTLSDILDVVGITSIIGSFTGTNVFTGEVLTDSEQSAAIFNAVINVGLLVLTVATAGVGSVAAVGIKAAASMAAKQVAKSLIIDMVAGIGGMAATHVLQSIGAPPWLAAVVGIGVSFAGGFSGQKVLDAVTSKQAVNSLLGQGIRNVDDLLASGRNIDDLLKAGIKPKALVDLGINSVDDLTKLGVNTLNDWKRLGFKAKDLKYFGVESLEQLDVVLKKSFDIGKHVDDSMKRFGMTLEDFQTMKLKPVSELSDLEVKVMKEIRYAIPGLDENTLLQKVIPISDIDIYLSGKFNYEIGGYVAKANDAKNISSYEDIVETFKLTYLDASGNRVFPDGGDGYAIIRFNSTSVDEASIPYGEVFGGNNSDGIPCTLNGFTGSENGMIIPEWKFNGYYRPEMGAEIITVINGEETIVGIFNGEKFVRP